MIYLVGMGPGSTKNLTLEAVEILKKSDGIISFGRIGDVAESFNKNIVKVKSLGEIENLLEDKISSNKTISILASGDPCFYGILEYLKRKEVNIDKVIPGVSSVQYMMAKLQKSWHNSNLISFHGREEEKKEKIEKILQNKRSIILTDSKNTPSYISQLLYSKGAKGKMYSGFNLSYEDEEITKSNIGDKFDNKNILAIVVVEIE